MPEQNLEEIVNTAVQDAKPALEQPLKEQEQPSEEPKDDQPTDEEPEETDPSEIEAKDQDKDQDKVDEYGLTSKDVLEAKQLLSALRDPNKAPVVVKFLVDNLKIPQPETNRQARQIASALTEELTEALGPELKYIAEKIGPVLERRLKESVESTTQRVNEIEYQKHLTDADKAQEVIGKRYFQEGVIPENLTKDISSLIDQIPVQSGQPVQDYLENLLFIAAGRKGMNLVKKTSGSVSDKISRNRTDAAGRLQASVGNRNPRPGEVAANPKRQMSLEDSVRNAVDEAKKQFET